jgi:G:T/U-mismatch repair DNA glycosylase
MPGILHKFRNHHVSQEIEILILGTFNPDIPDGPTFFYGRPRNYLWQLLPGCWILPSLRNSHLHDKLAFMAQYKIDFADLIASADVEQGQHANFLDTYIDPRVQAWKNIIELITQLPQLKAVYFTRKTFGGIPNIHSKIIEIRNHCLQAGIRFCLLETPARFANAAKQQQWINTIINRAICLQP